MIKRCDVLFCDVCERFIRVIYQNPHQPGRGRDLCPVCKAKEPETIIYTCKKQVDMQF